MEPQTADLQYDDDDGGGGRRCTACAAGGGLLLLGLAAFLGYMGADLLTGGALTRFIAGGIGIGAAAAPPAADSDNEGQEVTDSDDSA